jgi:hypothetical protein
VAAAVILICRGRSIKPIGVGKNRPAALRAGGGRQWADERGRPHRRPVACDDTEGDLAAEARAGRFDFATLHFQVWNFPKSFGFHVSIGITGCPGFALSEFEHTLE